MKVSLIYSRLNTSIHPPLGLLWIAAVLERGGHRVQVIDPLPGSGDFIGKIKDFGPDLIGVSIITTEYPKASQIFNRLKKEVHKAIYCAGGVHTTALPQETLNDFGLDFVVVGEGEYTMREVCERLEKGQGIKDVRGIGFKYNGNFILNERRELIEDLDALPLPARYLLNIEWYLTPPGLIRGAFLRRTIGILASRGCPYKCIFCASNNIFGRTVRRRSVNNVVDEIESLIKTYGIDGYYFYDDTFTIDKKYTLRFCEELKKRNIYLKWGCQVRVDTISEDILETMEETGCSQVDIGVESGSDKILRNLKKGTDVETIRKAFNMIHKSKIRALATFTVGNPGETVEDIKMTKRLAKEISPDHVKFFYLTPFPGSELYQTGLKNNWFDKDTEFSMDWQIRQADYPVMTINFTKEELKKIRSKLQNSFLISNYWSIIRDHWKLTLLMLFVLIKHPLRFIKEIIRIFRTGRIDYLIETTLEIYRIDKARKLSSIGK